MQIAVNAIPAVTGNVNERTFGYGVLTIIPGLMPHHSFYFEQDFDNDLLKPPNVTGIHFGEAVDDSIYLSIGRPHYLNSDFSPVVIAFVEADHIDFPERVWWRFGRQTIDPVQVDIEASTAILVPHERLRKVIADAYPHSSSKVTIVGHGPNPNPILPADEVTRRITKEVYGKEHSYFYAPSSGHESDNLERLFAAYDIFRARVPEPVRLLVQQPEDAKHSRAVRKAGKRAKFSSDIVFLPGLSDHDHRNVFSSARAIVFPSLSTRFPLPVLDAWTAEIPVLYTDNDILRGAGALVQGTDEKSIAEGMVALVTTPFLASGLVDNGKQRLQAFSWESVAERVAEVLREVGTKTKKT
ncbi:glycosyltransferase family 4 protein [Neolewinella aurantiaca]|uniref:Glycosyltransferase family 4 protein n=1 Tax=Neolewinella aurantiaca TaxID=2602767 RepID=A0A5C7FHE4_9BACT|nr:glycosyltransferase [Neolewinella aurantiaca]TXF90527.1 glycosyltransferase family 4 protein [Neolewinella aurantiaca]